MVHYDGASWTLHTPLGAYDYYALATLPDGEAWMGSNDAGQSGGIGHYSAGTWTQEYNTPDYGIDSTVMVSGGEGWAGGRTDGHNCGQRYCGGIVHYTRGLWSDWSPAVFHSDARGMALVSASKGWAVAERSGATMAPPVASSRARPNRTLTRWR
jgi:hypothetical protein